MESIISNIKSGLKEIQSFNRLAVSACANIYDHNAIRTIMDFNHIVNDLVIQIEEIEDDEKRGQIEFRKKINWLDDAKRFLAQELSPIKHVDYGLLVKLNAILLNSDRFSKEHRRILQPLEKKCKQIHARISNYAIPPFPECIIITAVPVEYLAFFRKLELIISGRNDFYYKIKNQKITRQLTWVEGIISRSNVSAKIVVIFPEKYASLESANSIHAFLKERQCNINSVNEIILVGVAGQLDKNNEMGIGDLVVSSKFYNSYDRKQAGAVSFSDKKLYGEDEKIPKKINIQTWTPTSLVEPMPKKTKNESNYGFKQVKIGPLVSGPEVVKDIRYKKKLQETFDDALAVEMEAMGCYGVLAESNCDFTIIKSICDWSTKGKKKHWQPYCADIATEFTIDYILAKYGQKTK